jgi:hypothetical protein
VKGVSITGDNLARQIIADHLVEGDMRPGEEIALKMKNGLRTADIWQEGCQRVGTREMGDAVLKAL